ncbi:MAG: hypothetical protein IJW00_01900 [Clostridia bacterium]|nr:hypothetical protein [Clostridia bacterium]
MKKKDMAMPKGICMPETAEASLEHTSPMLHPAVYAAPLKKRAREVLNGHHAENRLTLILGLLIVLGIGFAIPAILDCLLLLAEILGALSDGGEVLWPVILCYALSGLALLFITLPLLASLYRLAVLMTPVNAKEGDGVPRVRLFELLYPFTSSRAYGRTLWVALRGVGGFLLTFLPGVLLIASAFWWIPLVSQGLPTIVYVLLWVTVIAAACVSLWGMAVWSLRLSGYAYLVFSHPETTLSQVRREFAVCRGSYILPLWLLLSFGGWIALSVVAVFVPFVLHTCPYMLLSHASYGRYLAESSEAHKMKDSPSSPSGSVARVEDAPLPASAAFSEMPDADNVAEAIE